MGNLVKQQNDPSSRSLLESAQVLGIVPTAWFWTHENQRPIAWFYFPICLLLGVAGPLVTKALGGSVLLLLTLMLVPPFLLLGVIERYLRRQVLARRDDVRRELLMDDESLRALPPEDCEP